MQAESGGAFGGAERAPHPLTSMHANKSPLGSSLPRAFRWEAKGLVLYFKYLQAGRRAGSRRIKQSLQHPNLNPAAPPAQQGLFAATAATATTVAQSTAQHEKAFLPKWLSPLDLELAPLSPPAQGPQGPSWQPKPLPTHGRLSSRLGPLVTAVPLQPQLSKAGAAA